jgi:hypothetical protein
MQVIALNKGIGDPEVLMVSRKLDEVINNYHNEKTLTIKTQLTDN